MLIHITKLFNERLLWSVNGCCNQIFQVSVLPLACAGRARAGGCFGSNSTAAKEDFRV